MTFESLYQGQKVKTRMSSPIKLSITVSSHNDIKGCYYLGFNVGIIFKMFLKFLAFE